MIGKCTHDCCQAEEKVPAAAHGGQKSLHSPRYTVRAVGSETFSWIRNYLFPIRIQAIMKKQITNQNFASFFALNCTEHTVECSFKVIAGG